MISFTNYINLIKKRRVKNMETKLTRIDAVLVTTQEKGNPDPVYTLYAESADDGAFIPLGKISKEIAERL